MPDLEPHLFVIFGASGDLTERKLLPALYRLVREHDGASPCYVLGVARSALSDDDFREQARDALTDADDGDGRLPAWIDGHVFYESLGRDAPDYDGLRARIEALEAEHGLPGNRVFYLALPPATYPKTIEALGEHGLHRSDGWTRLVVEKPFGRDLESARKLNALIHRHFDEHAVYRIDHYLGKETVQNLLAFRFANLLFESVWNRDRIAQVEITVAEDLGLAGRAGYYDRAGALRDMIQNHLTQLFTLVAMEVPSAFEADAIRREKIKVLDSVTPLDPRRDVVFGQYVAGTVDGEAVPGYLDESDLDGASSTETFVALRLSVENWRWQGVPFLLRTGKRLPRRLTQVTVRFRRAPVSLFQPFEASCRVSANVLRITLQPDEGFDLQFEVKRPGEPFTLETQRFRFRYEDTFGPLPDAYETLLGDVIEGDQTLFVHADEAEASWRLYAPILEDPPEPQPYPAGSWGPQAAARFLSPAYEGLDAAEPPLPLPT